MNLSLKYFYYYYYKLIEFTLVINLLTLLSILLNDSYWPMVLLAVDKGHRVTNRNVFIGMYLFFFV